MRRGFKGKGTGPESSARRTRAAALIVVAGLFALAAACAHRQAPVAVETHAGQAAVDIRASDFKFTPNNLDVMVGSRVEFRIENVSGTTHNFTLKDPAGKVLTNVDLPAHQTVPVTVDFPSAGTYPFHCAKGAHAELGMKGWVTVRS